MEQKITIPEGYELQKVNDSEYRIVKKINELPESWEEFRKNNKLKPGEAYINDYSNIICTDGGFERNNTYDNILPNKEYAEAILAFCKLIQLRDCYRQGWTPDWNVYDMKKTIELHYENMVCSEASHVAKIFAFQSAEIRDKFFDNFEDLLKKVRPLFM